MLQLLWTNMVVTLLFRSTVDFYFVWSHEVKLRHYRICFLSVYLTVLPVNRGQWFLVEFEIFVILLPLHWDNHRILWKAPSDERLTRQCWPIDENLENLKIEKQCGWKLGRNLIRKCLNAVKPWLACRTCNGLLLKVFREYGFIRNLCLRRIWSAETWEWLENEWKIQVCNIKLSKSDQKNTWTGRFVFGEAVVNVVLVWSMKNVGLMMEKDLGGGEGGRDWFIARVYWGLDALPNV